MSKKNSIELMAQIEKMKQREAQLKVELAYQKKLEDKRARQELCKRKMDLAEVLMQHLGDRVLEQRDEVELYILDNIEEMRSYLSFNGESSKNIDF